jgi:hypothetical protein
VNKVAMTQTSQYSRTLIRVAIAIAILGLLHHADHVFRGNYSGWPFTPQVTPFTFSLLIYPLLIYGIRVTRRGKPTAKYWLVVGTLLAALITFVHYIPIGKYERISTDLYLPYADPYADPSRSNLAAPEVHRLWFQHVYGSHASPVYGWLAVVVVLLLTVATYVLVIVSIMALREEARQHESRRDRRNGSTRLASSP